MKKKLCLLLVFTFVVAMLTGCNAVMDVSLKDDFSGSFVESFLISQEEIEQFELKELFEAMEPDQDGYIQTDEEKVKLRLSDETVDGATYKKLTEEVSFESPEQFEELMTAMSLNYNENYFCLSTLATPADEEDKKNAETAVSDMIASDETIAKLMDTFQNMKATITVTVPFEIIDSNGTVSDDKKSVSWDESTTETRYYAIFKDAQSQNPPVITGAENNKYYNSAILLDIDSEVLLKSVDVNGKPALSGKVSIIEDGDYTVTATDSSDKAASLHFMIDTKKPTVSGVKNGKKYKKAVTITFKDALSGVKKATLNGKKIKSGKIVSKKGSYTLKVTDKTGNTKTVKFKVK